MGYELHITRAAEWLNSEQDPITADEWLALVAADPELKLQSPNGPYFAEWPGPCRYPGGTWFDWDAGQVYTKNPDRATLIKLLQLASRLRARVQGDDGEEYTKPEDLPSEEGFAALSPPARQPWGMLLAIIAVNAVIITASVWAYHHAPRARWPAWLAWFEAYCFYAILTIAAVTLWHCVCQPLLWRWGSNARHWLSYVEAALSIAGLFAAPAIIGLVIGKLFGFL